MAEREAKSIAETMVGSRSPPAIVRRLTQEIAMQLFCDQCGTDLVAQMLRPDSKFCSDCGKALSEYVKRQSVNLLKTPPKSGRRNRGYAANDTPKSFGYSGKKRKLIDEDEPNNDDALGQMR